MDSIDTTVTMVKNVYSKTKRNLEIIRKRLKRPLTYAEKVIYGHLSDPQNQDVVPKKSYLALNPDRVAMQDATAQMAILQFMQSQRERTAVPTTLHCDHLIVARRGEEEDLKGALDENSEVYQFLESASRKYGIGFWKPGAGIIHQVILENYAFPGGLMIGTDSHTPNAGGLGMFAAGVGGADAVDVMAGFPWEVLHPEIIGVHLKGKLNGWTSPKDVILKLLGILTVKGGTNRVVEYFGEGVKSISSTGKATITNMGAELGATTSIFPYDERMAQYLKATGREEIAEIADQNKEILKGDEEVYQNPEKFFAQIVEIDLSTLEPHIVGPHTPDLAREVSKFKEAVIKENYPNKLSAVLIGSCTNSSYEDLGRAGDVLKMAKESGLTLKSTLYVTPGSLKVKETLKRDGILDIFEECGAKILSSACGPCIGQWKREDDDANKLNSIMTSYNRNFPARNDGNQNTLAFISSPEICVAYALSGRLDFNPLEDEIKNGEKSVKLKEPSKVPDLPKEGFSTNKEAYIPPAEDPTKVEVKVSENSERLQLLKPFEPWDGRDFKNLPVLIKVKGKCTTDHISPAGVWLKYRGHLDKISDNLLLGAVNAFTEKKGESYNIIKGIYEPTSKVARFYKEKGIKWVVVGDENYGEGSSREHAAMSPRFLGAAAIISRSFARIHETNLKKQGILPLTFSNLDDYHKIGEKDTITITGLNEIAPSKPLKAIIHHGDGKDEEILLNHTLSYEQIEWFKKGSALNTLIK